MKLSLQENSLTKERYSETQSAYTLLRIPYKTLVFFRKTKLSLKNRSLDSPLISDLNVYNEKK